LLAVLGLLAVFHSAHWAWAAPGVVAPGAFLILFFRNPRRETPPGPGLLVAPADGTVRDIEVVEEKEFVGGPCVRLGVFLSVFDVHLNRAPAAGRVLWLQYRQGAFHDARSPEAVENNESNSIGILREDAGGPAALRLLVKQVSGAIARRIVCPLAKGMTLDRGGLLGMIKYGSRTELYIPQSAGAEVLVRVGQKVKGGSTIVARWPEAAAGS
jgi:phosphatidylserine decarboxylase